MQYYSELLIRLLSDDNALGDYLKQVILRRTMQQVEHQATIRTWLRARRSGELVAAPGDLEQHAMKFVMLEFPLGLWVFHLPMLNAFYY